MSSSLPIKTKVSSFIDYKEPIFLTWLSLYEATDHDIPDDKIEFLRPDYQLLRRVSDSHWEYSNASTLQESERKRVTFKKHLKKFVATEFLPSHIYVPDEDIWFEAGTAMALEVVNSRLDNALGEAKRKRSEKDKWRAWLFDAAKGSIDTVVRPIYSHLISNDDGGLVVELEIGLERKLQCKIDVPVDEAEEIILHLMKRPPSDEKILESFYSLLKSQTNTRRFLAEYIDGYLSISSMTSLKSLKRSIADGRKIWVA